MKISSKLCTKCDFLESLKNLLTWKYGNFKARIFKFLVEKKSNNFEAIFGGIIENHSNSYIRMRISLWMNL